MTEIYVVTDGDYSDYHICGLFSKKELAQKYIDAQGKDFPPRIEPWTLDWQPPGWQEGYSVYWVSLTRSGDVIEVNPDPDPPMEKGYLWGGFWMGRGEEKIFRGCVAAKDEEYAVKIMNERRARSIAEEGEPNGD